MSCVGSEPLGAQPAATPGRARAGNQQPTVLVLSVDDFTRPHVRLLFAAISDTFSAAPDPPVLFFESLDALRFGDRQQIEDLRGWLRRKYLGTRIDLVVTLGEDALGFLIADHGEPWPGARVLYVEAGSVKYDARTELPQAGGVLFEDHFLDALGVIRTILPGTRQVALVYGASAVERGRFSGFAERVRMAGLDPIQLAGASIEDTRTAVSRLPAHTVVVLLAPTIDANGLVLSARQACELLSSTTNVPAFTPGAHDLGCGVVGGLMQDWTLAGRVLGEEVLSRLARPSTDVVTVAASRFTTLAFDDRQLERWGIPESRLPHGAIIRFREPSLWRDHRRLVLTVLGVTLLQSLLIAGMVLEHRRRRKAEMTSRRNLAALAHMDRRAAMGELATSLAHELNQPLNAILQNAGVAQVLLASNALPPALGEIGEIISDIRKDDIRASEVIRRMRGLLQKHELEAAPVEPNTMILETLAIVRTDARSRGIDLEAELSDDVQPILADRVHLQQVLLNLLMNAIDAVGTMPPGRRRVRVSTSRRHGEMRLAVADTGTGIAPDRLSRVFEPFFTTKGGGRGMGMGLAIARDIVETHAGRIAAENNAGGGATVWFSIPVAPDAPSGEMAAVSAQANEPAGVTRVL